MARQQSSRTGGQVFVDESKARDYLLVAVTVTPRNLVVARKAVRSLILPGQHRIHMKQEGDSRRRAILAALTALHLPVTIYRDSTPDRREPQRRDACIDALVRNGLRDKCAELILELDRTLERSDHRRLIGAMSRASARDVLAHRHATAAAEPLLVIPDAIGWAWARGGDWRRRCNSLEIEIIDV